MTVTKQASLIQLFESKIDEAVSYVPKMCPAEKLKAVNFWNIVSDKLQDIVNSNASDITALALKMDNNEIGKDALALNNSETLTSISHNNVSSSEFMSLPTNIAVNAGSPEQYHTVDLNNLHLLPSVSPYSNITESSLIYTVSSAPHINIVNNSSNSTQKSTICDQFIAIEHLAHNSCNVTNSSLISQIETDPCSEQHNSNSISEEISSQEASQTHTQINHSLPANKNVSLSSSETLTSPDKNCSKNYSKYPNLTCDNNDSSKDCNNGYKSDFETGANPDDSNSNHEQFKNAAQNKETADSEIINETEVYPCKDCDKKFLDKPSLSVHTSIHSKPYFCTVCLSQFATKGNLSVHMRRHTGEKPYACSKCSSHFTTKGNLKRHLKTHTGEKPYRCTCCDSRFTEKKSLVIHMRRHTGEKPYQCKECGKRFSQTGVLQSHMAMHLDRKMHLCENCGKSFRQKSQLHIHQLRHEKIKKHNCLLCEARFLTKGDLDRHMRMHTGERPFECSECSKRFTRQQSLNEHMNRHYGLRPYACKYCSKAFAEVSACKKHIKLHEKMSKSKDENSLSSNQQSTLEDDEQSSTNQKVDEQPENNQVVGNTCLNEVVKSDSIIIAPKVINLTVANHQALTSFIENFLQ